MEERLQKIIAAAGIASRRKAEQLILAGEVTVNGRIVQELGTKADPEKDHIKVRGKLINPRLEHKEKLYILLNKPKGYLSSVSDPYKRPLVLDLLPPELRKVHPVGRLDFNTEGLLLLTNDGEFTNIITRAGRHCPKVYQVKIKGAADEKQIERLRQGVVIKGKRTAPAEIKLLEVTRDGGNTWYEITLTEGRNQQIRKMFDQIGHSVMKLRRVRIAHLTDKGLKPGEFRHLTHSEVKQFFKLRPSD